MFGKEFQLALLTLICLSVQYGTEVEMLCGEQLIQCVHVLVFPLHPTNQNQNQNQDQKTHTLSISRNTRQDCSARESVLHDHSEQAE